MKISDPFFTLLFPLKIKNTVNLKKKKMALVHNVNIEKFFYYDCNFPKPHPSGMDHPVPRKLRLHVQNEEFRDN